MNKPSGVVVPHDKLNDEILRAIIEEFVTREGTDYGEHSYTLDEKVSQVKKLLQRGEVSILYDEKLDSCTLISSRELR